jgi:hypothetical protein
MSVWSQHRSLVTTVRFGLSSVVLFHFVCTNNNSVFAQYNREQLKIEGAWNENSCGSVDGWLKVSPTAIEGFEWECKIIRGTISPTRWELAALCSEAGGYEKIRIPVSKVIIYIEGGQLIIKGNKPLNAFSSGSKNWRVIYRNRCGD